MGDACRAVMIEPRWLGAPQGAQDSGQHDRQPIAAGIHHPGFAQHGQQIGSAPDRVLAGVERALDDVGKGQILLAVAGLRAKASVGHVGQLRGDAVSHLAHHRQDRALRGLANRAVGLVGGARQGGPDQHRIDELAGTAGQLLRGAADQLGEDHTRVATRSQKSGARDRGDDLVAADLVDCAVLGVGGEAVQLGQHGAQREHHVVAGVAVGDGEHVQVVDLFAAVLKRRQAGLDQRAETDDAGIGRPFNGLASRSPGCRHRTVSGL